MEHRVWSMEYGAWSTEHRAWSMEHRAAQDQQCTSLQQLPGCAPTRKGKLSLSHIAVHRCPHGPNSTQDGARPSVSPLSPCPPRVPAPAAHGAVCSGKGPFECCVLIAHTTKAAHVLNKQLSLRWAPSTIWLSKPCPPAMPKPSKQPTGFSKASSYI